MGEIDIVGRESEAEKLYKLLNTETYKKYPFQTEDLGEQMSVVNEVIRLYWKHRFLLDHQVQRAYEFMNKEETLVTVTLDDIDWDSLINIKDKKAMERAKRLYFHFPSFILKYENGVAQVSWLLNPDGRYYMDKDGYGMTDDEEVIIYGFIDRAGKVLVKFKSIEKYEELKPMRAEAEQKAILNNLNK